MSETIEKANKLARFTELCGSYLNLKTIADYAKETGISYNGAKKFRKVVILF